ncbi:MAG TPA: hypothetical protein VEW48_25530 [Thermoanaerobaculia bacterium]|nr:hypothetical protein [Thermoanaerobaculia bacterium]
MARNSTAVVQKKLELRRQALKANEGELSHMAPLLERVDATLTELTGLSTQQASLTASKQDSTKRLEEVSRVAARLLTFIDAGIRQHYGTRSEKLVEFGQQPFRSQPRIRVVGVDGKPLKPAPAPAEPPLPPLNE